MIRSVVAVLLLAVPAAADEPVRFVWKTGTAHTYTVQHDTTVTETAPDEGTKKLTTTTHVTKLALTRRWDVTAVDADGTGTLTMTITAMKQEHTKPDGTTIVLDSAGVDGAKEMAAFLNKPILTAKVDPRGRLKDVTATGGDAVAARLRAELPFRIELPEAGPATVGPSTRGFTIKLDPPLGTGETHEATQTYTFKGRKDNYAVFGVETSLKNPPTTPADLQPLVSWLWQGDVFIDAATGRYHASKLTAKKEIANHQGNGTKFVYTSEFAETVVR